MAEKKEANNEVKKEVKPAAKPEVKKDAKPAAKPAPAKKPVKPEEDKVYHISKEAINYAKSVAGNQEGRIVIHKEDGSFRKLSY